MNTRYQTDRDLHHDLQDFQESAGQDREISLGTTTILGIFFALALLCAVFFGFGYSLGRRSAPPVVSPAAGTTASDNNDSKPSPASPANQTTDKQSATQSEIIPLDATDSTDATAHDTQPAPAPELVKTSALSRPDAHTSPSANRAVKAAALVPVAAAATTSASSIVQVAAMSHQEDADVVAVDLKRRGYTVAIRHEPQDKLFHVQIGPFTTRKETDAMRQRLQTDGYNSAIIK